VYGVTGLILCIYLTIVHTFKISSLKISACVTRHIVGNPMIFSHDGDDVALVLERDKNGDVSARVESG
jgi:hypothetical protein